MKLTRNSSLAARESAVTLLTVLESPVRILLILNEIVNPINSKSAVGLMTVLLIRIFLPSSGLEIGKSPYSPKEEAPHAMVLVKEGTPLESAVDAIDGGEVS